MQQQSITAMSRLGASKQMAASCCLVVACTPADDAGRAGLANPRRPIQQDCLLGHILWLAPTPALCFTRLLMLQVYSLPVT